MHIITYYLYITFSTSTSMCRKLYNNGMHDNNKAKHIYWKIQPGAWLHLYTVKQTHCVPHTIRILHLWKKKSFEKKKAILWTIFFVSFGMLLGMLFQLLPMLPLLHMVLGCSFLTILWVSEPIYWYTNSSSNDIHSLAHSIANCFHCIVQSTHTQRACVCCYSDNSLIVVVVAVLFHLLYISTNVHITSSHKSTHNADMGRHESHNLLHTHTSTYPYTCKIVLFCSLCTCICGI